MGIDTLIVTFEAILITRGGGTGAKRVMLENPEISEFIKGFTGWNRVEPGSLTMDNTNPLPLRHLEAVRPLAEQPEGLIKNPRDSDARIAALRGLPKFYAGIATGPSGRRSRVVLSQQPRPAVPNRLEVLGDVLLREALAVKDQDRLQLAIYHAEDWNRLEENLGRSTGASEVQED